jgi:hypothetical protein
MAQYTKTRENMYVKLPQHYQMAIKYVYQIAVKYYKWPLNRPAISILRPSKIDQNLDFWFENKPSGNPDVRFLVFSLCTAVSRNL